MSSRELFIGVVFYVRPRDPPHTGWVEIVTAPSREELETKVKEANPWYRDPVMKVVHIAIPPQQKKISIAFLPGNEEVYYA